jgi:ribosome biogenesis GTPase
MELELELELELEVLGWTEPFVSSFAAIDEPELVPARVAGAQREHYRLIGRDGAHAAQLSGRYRHRAGAGELPAVGDWVATRIADRNATIIELLPRKSCLMRKRVDGSSAPQVLAANLDCVFLVTSLNLDFSPRRIERTLAMIWDSGAQPVLLLNKLDLCPEPERYLAEAEAVALGVPIHALSAERGDGLEQLAGYLQRGRSVALIGSSGVGKSTLVNRLLGETRLTTAAVRADDDRGRHTTTTRELFVLPRGGVLIDTPGMREIGLWDAAEGLRSAFEDIEALIARCRFGDCRHATEPGCALRAALANGLLAHERYDSYYKLQRELAHEARRHDPLATSAYRRELRSVMRERTRNARRSPKR